MQSIISFQIYSLKDDTLWTLFNLLLPVKMYFSEQHFVWKEFC